MVREKKAIFLLSVHSLQNTQKIENFERMGGGGVEKSQEDLMFETFSLQRMRGSGKVERKHSEHEVSRKIEDIEWFEKIQMIGGSKLFSKDLMV